MKKFLVVSLLTLTPVLFAQGAESHLISVPGVADKSVEPNLITLNVEVWSKATTAEQAQKAQAKQAQGVQKIFADFKIKKEDIQTDNFSLNPENVYDQKSQANKMVGFRVTQSFMVTFRKVSEAGHLLDALASEKSSEDGGVNLNSIAWDSDQREALEVSVLGEAVKDARSKADEIAKASGTHVIGVSHISYAGRSRPPMPVHMGMMAKNMTGDATATELSTGQVKIHVEVSADYLVK